MGWTGATACLPAFWHSAMIAVPSALALLRIPFTEKGRAMAKKNVSHFVMRPGKHVGDLPITIPVAEDLVSVPGIPTRESDVAFFSREDPLENMAVAESASADWARSQRRSYSAELREFYDEHDRHMEPIVEWVRRSGELKQI